jgi:hypothetical protein
MAISTKLFLNAILGNENGLKEAAKCRLKFKIR